MEKTQLVEKMNSIINANDARFEKLNSSIERAKEQLQQINKDYEYNENELNEILINEELEQDIDIKRKKLIESKLQEIDNLKKELEKTIKLKESAINKLTESEHTRKNDEIYKLFNKEFSSIQKSYSKNDTEIVKNIDKLKSLLETQLEHLGSLSELKQFLLPDLDYYQDPLPDSRKIITQTIKQLQELLNNPDLNEITELEQTKIDYVEHYSD
jgi:chromosome segregation ATPase